MVQFFDHKYDIRYINSKTSPGALFKWEAWEVILLANIRFFLELINVIEIKSLVVF